MGFRISWMAAQQSKDAVISALGMGATGAEGEYSDFKFSAAALPNGWTIIWSEDQSYFDPPRSLELSKHFPLMTCWINETVMCSYVRHLSGGKIDWAVWHEGHEDRNHLASEGSPPAAFREIEAELRAAQDADEDGDVDLIFDIPTRLAESICGFKHDEWMDDPDDPTPFFELVPDGGIVSTTNSGTAKRGFISRLFGRH